MRTPPGTCARASSPTFWPRVKIACSPSSAASSGASGSCTFHHSIFGHWRPDTYRDLESRRPFLELIVRTRGSRDSRLRPSARRGRFAPYSEAAPSRRQLSSLHFVLLLRRFLRLPPHVRRGVRTASFQRLDVVDDVAGASTRRLAGRRARVGLLESVLGLPGDSVC